MHPASLITTPFRLLAEVRHARAFHPDGFFCAGIATRAGQSSLPFGDGPVTARISKGIGLPGRVPDIVGLAVRLRVPSDAGDVRYWDVLLSGPAPLGGRIPLPLPSIHWRGTMVSSLTPYRQNGTPFWIRGRFVEPTTTAEVSLEALHSSITEGQPVAVTIETATGAGGFTPVLDLRLDTVLVGDDVDFDPIRNLAPGIDFLPEWLSTVRDLAYRGSRAGRHAIA
ncbi:hypothetical protein ACLQ3C_16850 [Gordonia sp. DT30]|uniref:hypothetical protein n=1 Tax=unclassified Gordonia (in: high G+C Gram-positive bacteria) TaxID=2657482 RepID=UPI003CECC196